MNTIKKFMQDEEGAAAVEYGLLVALIAAVIVGTVAVLGPQLKVGFCKVITALNGAGIAGACPA